MKNLKKKIALLGAVTLALTTFVANSANATFLNEKNIQKASAAAFDYTGQDSICFNRKTDTSITFDVTYPNQNAYGNRLQLCDLTTGNWQWIQPDNYLTDGTYTFNNLIPGRQYRASLTWHDGTRWHDLYVRVTTTNPVNYSKVLVFVHENVFDGLQDSLDQYRADLLKEGYCAEVVKYTSGTASDVRNIMKNKYQQNNKIKGAFLIGDIPYAETKNNWESNDWPGYLYDGLSDLYYMDLDGSWINKDNDAAFEEHTNGSGDKKPEISCGRLYGSTLADSVENELAMYKDYFRRNHEYRTNQTTCTGALSSYENGIVTQEVDGLRVLYPNTTSIDCMGTSSLVKNEIVKNYEWASIIAHSWSNALSGMSTDYIRTTKPSVLFYNTHACGTARFKDDDYVAGACVLEANGLTYLGSTTLAYYLPEWDTAYTSKLANNGTFGDALLDIFDLSLNNSNNSVDWTGQEMILLGDPTLKVK